MKLCFGVALTLDEYETVRSGATHFALRPGHEDQGVETVVARNERFVVVKKHARESEIAEATDPPGLNCRDARCRE